jgi:ADP-ribosylglycohydrolase
VCCEHVWLTHPDDTLLKVVSTYVSLLHNLLTADDQSIIDLLHQSGQVVPGTNIRKLLQLSSGDGAVVGGHYSTACYITDSWPSVCYLAAKYFDDPANALLINTNLGGENAHRGSVLGTIVGAASGEQNQTQFDQLLYMEDIHKEIDDFMNTFGQTTA